MAELDQLIKDASKVAGQYGGLISLLLVIKRGQTTTVTFDKKTARFRVDGKEVPIEKILAELARIESSTSRKVLLYTNKLNNGVWTLQQWEDAMEKLLRDHHHLFGALALGGLAVAVSDPTVQRRVVRDVNYLRGFVQAISAGRKDRTNPLSLQNIIRRGRSYIRSLTMTYHLLNHQAHIIAGYEYARRVLTRAEHCRTKGKVEGCVEAHLRGWISIRDMPPIGTLVCKQFCKCYLKFKR